MEIKIKRLTKTAIIPTRGTEESAGLDMYADVKDSVLIKPHSTVMIPTNIAMEIPNGYYGALYSRSGISFKRGLRLASGTSVIDSDYRGGIGVPMHNDLDFAQYVAPNERIAQLVIQKYEKTSFDEVEELSDTDRSVGGFGSTGTH